MHFRSLGRVLALALVASALQLVGPPSTALAALSRPSSLAPASTSISGQPVLEWSRIRGAARYDVQVSTSSGFTDAVYSVTTTNRRATPTAKLPSGRLYWRVRGVSSSGANGPWSTASFRVNLKAGPSLQAPGDGADLHQPQDPVLLTWSPVAQASDYVIEVSTNDDKFVNPKAYSSKTTSLVLPDPGPEQTYYWHVKANFAGGFSTRWSQVRSFHVYGIEAPELVYPDDSATTEVQDAVLDWKPVPGAVRYEVRVSLDDQFNNNLIDTAIVKSTRYARPRSYENDQYWWQVRAVDVNNNKSPWTTSLNQFQRNWPDQPELLHPAEGQALGNPFYLEWSGTPHASQYALDVGSQQNFSPGTFATCITKATTYTTRFGTDRCHPSIGINYWRVRPLDAYDGNVPINGLYSQIGTFNYQPGMVTQISPTPGATVEVPTLSWAPYPGAEKYNVKVVRANGLTAVSGTTYSTSWTPTGTQRLKPADGPFKWTVQAVGNDGVLTQLPIFNGNWTFQVTGEVVDDPAKAALQPTNPIDGGHSTKFPQLAWEPYFASDGTPAAYYEVWVGAHGSNSFSPLTGRFPYSAATDDSKNFISAGAYDWFVAAYTSTGGLLGHGPNGMFVIDNLNSVSGQRLSLTGLGLGDPETTCTRYITNPSPTTAEICTNLQQTPVLSWDPVPNASYYMIYLARDRELNTLVYDPVSEVRARTSNTMWTPTELLEDSQAGTAYYWYIRPCKAPLNCGPDPEGTLNAADNAFDKRSNPVTGLVAQEHDTNTALPDAGQDTQDPPNFSDEVVLSWDDYLVTSRAGNGKDVTGLPSTVEARSYRVQISTDKTFPDDARVTHESPLVDQTTYTAYSATLPEGPLYWRVQAIDGSGKELAWSSTKDLVVNARAIEKRSPRPLLSRPADGERVGGTPFFTWAPLNYAATYEVEIYQNNDTTFSSANRVVYGKTEQATYAPNVILPVDGSPYLWRVRRLDVDNKPGEWSAVRSFTVKGNPPALVSPASGAYVSARDSLFTWKPVQGAARYRFEVRPAGGTYAQTMYTVGLSWAPMTTFTNGRYEWRVTAYDAANKPRGISAWRSFKVDGTAPRVVGKSPTKRAARTANFVVKFSEPVRKVNTTTFALWQKGVQHRLSAKVTMSNGGKTATLNPAKRLRSGRTYTAKLLKGIRDRAGNPLKPLSWKVVAK